MEDGGRSDEERVSDREGSEKRPVSLHLSLPMMRAVAGGHREDRARWRPQSTPRSRRNGIAAATASSGVLWLISNTRGTPGGRPRAMYDQSTSPRPGARWSARP